MLVVPGRRAIMIFLDSYDGLRSFSHWQRRSVTVKTEETNIEASKRRLSLLLGHLERSY